MWKVIYLFFINIFPVSYNVKISLILHNLFCARTSFPDLCKMIFTVDIEHRSARYTCVTVCTLCSVSFAKYLNCRLTTLCDAHFYGSNTLGAWRSSVRIEYRFSLRHNGLRVHTYTRIQHVHVQGTTSVSVNWIIIRIRTIQTRSREKKYEITLNPCWFKSG